MSLKRRSRPALSLLGVAAMTVAYLLSFVVLKDPDMGSKFTNGVAPPGTEMSGLRAAAAGSVVAAVLAVASAAAGRLILPVLLVLAACAPFAIITLVTLQLAF